MHFVTYSFLLCLKIYEANTAYSALFSVPPEASVDIRILLEVILRHSGR